MAIRLLLASHTAVVRSWLLYSLPSLPNSLLLARGLLAIGREGRPKQEK